MTLRRWTSTAGMLVVAAATFLTLTAGNEPPNISHWYTNPGPGPGVGRLQEWIVQPDSMCQTITADTIRGPSIPCYGAREVILNVRANSGSCSLMVAQVSMNDTAWVSTSNALFSSTGVFTIGDSLNTGGANTSISGIEILGTQPSPLSYRFARVLVTRRKARPTYNICESRLDSLRIRASVIW